jgi:dTMP kinase
MSTPTGKLITLEGGDGAGKTTQASKLAQRLRAAGRECVLVREPGGTPVGEEVRRIVKSSVSRTPRTELLLFEAARAELVETVVRPALLRGAFVVADRFADSSLAYQGFGRGLDLEEIRALNRFATGGLEPDLTLLLDIDPAAGLARSGGRDAAGNNGRQFEGQPEGFHRRLVEGFRELARREPKRWRVVNASGTPEAVSAAVWKAVAQAFSLQ